MSSRIGMYQETCRMRQPNMRLDLMEGKVANRLKQYKADYGAGTAVTLRLCSHWFGTGRCVVGDSAFAYVKTLVALKLLGGLSFMGAVKTAHKLFPKAYLTKWFEDGSDHRRPRGSWTVLSSSFPMNALPSVRAGQPETEPQNTYAFYVCSWLAR